LEHYYQHLCGLQEGVPVFNAVWYRHEDDIDREVKDDEARAQRRASSEERSEGRENLGLGERTSLLEGLRESGQEEK
jgi:hypothetical protein